MQAGLILGRRVEPGYTDKLIRYRMAMNVPAATNAVTPIENKTLKSSVCLVTGWWMPRIARLPDFLLLAIQCDIAMERRRSGAWLWPHA